MCLWTFTSCHTSMYCNPAVPLDKHDLSSLSTLYLSPMDIGRKDLPFPGGGHGRATTGELSMRMRSYASHSQHYLLQTSGARLAYHRCPWSCNRLMITRPYVSLGILSSPSIRLTIASQMPVGTLGLI